MDNFMSIKQSHIKGIVTSWYLYHPKLPNPTPSCSCAAPSGIDGAVSEEGARHKEVDHVQNPGAACDDWDDPGGW